MYLTLSEGDSLNLQRAEEGIFGLSVFSDKFYFLFFQAMDMDRITEANSLAEWCNFRSRSDSRKGVRNWRLISCASYDSEFLG